MGCGGLGKSARVRLRAAYIWFEFWTTRGKLRSVRKPWDRSLGCTLFFLKGSQFLGET